MDHFLRSYLERRSMEELRGVLGYCLSQENTYDYESTIRLIMDVLRERLEIQETPPEVLEYWTKHLEALIKDEQW